MSTISPQEGSGIKIADLHTHSLLPMYYFRKNAAVRNKTARFYPYTPFGSHIDVPRLKESGVGMIVSCVYALARFPRMSCYELAKDQIALFEAWMRDHADAFEHAKNPADVDRIMASGKIAVVLALEGGHHLDGRLETLEYFRNAGVFYVTLTHFLNNPICESSLFADWTPEPPLSAFGREAIDEMNRLGIIVDVAHASETAFWQVMEHAKLPPIYSHGGSSQLRPHHRNLTDDQARAIAERGGLLGVILYPGYLKKGSGGGTTDDVIRHLEHWMKVAGPENLAIGSDMNGVRMVKDVPDYAHMPRLADAVAAAFGEPLARRILFENAVHFMRKFWAGK